MAVLFVYSCTVWSLRPYIHSYCCSHQSQISQNVYCSSCGSEKHSHQDRCRKETSKNDAAWSFIIEDLTTSNRASVATEGSCFSFLFLCRVNCEFSVLQYFFLKHMVLENSATCLAKLFKPDEVNISRATFMFGGYGRLLDIRLWNNLFCVNLIFRNGIVLKPADSMRMEKQGQLGGKVFCLLTEGNFCSLKVTVASWVGQTYVLSLKLAALVLKQCPGKPLWIFFSSIRLRKGYMYIIW